jgi:hypothetical protein
MLEEFGLTEKPEGGYDINLQRSVNGVVNELSNYFGFKRHDGIVEFTAPGSEAANLRRILNSRNANQNAIENAVDRISAGAEVGGATVYTGDLDLGFPKKPSYMVFVSNATQITNFPFMMGEEFTHGEHMAYGVEDLGLSYTDYKSTFHEVTEEFLGYMGRQRIIKVAGLTGNYNPDLNWTRDLNESEWAHWLGYLSVDHLEEQGKQLPAKELFHAQDETIFWQILLEGVKDPIEFNFCFPPTLRFENLVQPLNNILRNAKADKAIKLDFSYQ